VARVVAQPDGQQQMQSGTTDCAPLPWQQWQLPSGLEVLEATTCEYRCSLYGSSRYHYHPSVEGWVADYFIQGDAHAIVYWNVRTGAVMVRPRHGEDLSAEGAREAAEWARATIYPGIDMSTLQLDLRSCDEQPCPPWGASE